MTQSRTEQATPFARERGYAPAVARTAAAPYHRGDGLRPGGADAVHAHPVGGAPVCAGSPPRLSPYHARSARLALSGDCPEVVRGILAAGPARVRVDEDRAAPRHSHRALCPIRPRRCASDPGESSSGTMKRPAPAREPAHENRPGYHRPLSTVIATSKAKF